ncbi:MAG: ABC transporter permease [Georgenia sp.]
MRATLAIAALELRRFLRDRSNIFFVFIFPLILVLLIGAQFGGGSSGRVAIAGDPSELRAALVTQLAADDVAVTLGEPDRVREQLARGRTDVGILVPDDVATAFAAAQDVELEVILGSQAGSPVTFQQVQTAVQAVTAERGQLQALTDAGLGAEQAAQALTQARAHTTPSSIEVVDVNEIAQAFAGVSGFDVGAAGETLLFVFLISLAGSATLIQSRRYGVTARTLAAPVSAGQTLGGQALGRFVIAAFQGVYIMVATALLFGVSWGNVYASMLVLVAFSAVAAGAAMLIGSLLDNEAAASGVGVGLGLVLAALGGSMLPLELFPDTLRTVAHITPHAWAYEAFAEIQRHDGGIVDVLPQLGVLTGMAVILLVLGAWALRGSMSRAL